MSWAGDSAWCKIQMFEISRSNCRAANCRFIVVLVIQDLGRKVSSLLVIQDLRRKVSRLLSSRFSACEETGSKKCVTGEFQMFERDS